MPDAWPWKPNPDYRRLLKALRREGESGYVPLLELFADPEVIASFLGETSAARLAQADQVDKAMVEQFTDHRIRFWHRLGYDAFWHAPVLHMPLPCSHTDDTALLPQAKRRWQNEQAGLITNWAEFERYPWPRAADANLYPLEYAARQLPDGMGILASTGGIFEPVMRIMGYQTMCLALYDQPDLVEAMFARVAEIVVPLAEALADMDGVIALWMGDDIGFNSGTLIAPAHLRRFVFPIQKRIAAIAHARGMPFMLHSCGNLEAVMGDLIDDVGIDAKHSFEDAIVPVEAFTERYGERIGVIGGVDMDLLARGTEEAVRRRTRQILEACAPSRGYVLGSGNSVANYVPLNNFLAMLDEGRRFNSGC